MADTVDMTVGVTYFGSLWPILERCCVKSQRRGVTHTNPNKIWATMLHVFQSDSKTCNMLLQQKYCIKNLALKLGSGNIILFYSNKPPTSTASTKGSMG